MWKLTLDTVRRNLRDIVVVWLVVVLFIALALHDLIATKLLYIFLYQMIVIIIQAPGSDSRIHWPMARLWRTLPLARAEIADWLWLTLVIAPSFFFTSATLAAILAFLGYTGGKHPILVNPLVVLICTLVAAACGTFFQAPMRLSRTAKEWLYTFAALAVAIVIFYKAPFSLQQMDATTTVAMAFGAWLVAISFSQRHRLEQTLDLPHARSFRARFEALLAHLGRRLGLSKVYARRRANPRWPRLMFYRWPIALPILVMILLFAMPTRDILSGNKESEYCDVLCVFFALTVIAALLLPLPPLRAQRQWPLSRFRLTLWQASYYVIFGVTLALCLLPWLHVAQVDPLPAGAISLAIVGTCVLLGGLRTSMGDHAELHLALALLSIFIGALLTYGIWQSIRGSNPLAVTSAMAFVALLAMALGAAILYGAIACTSEVYRYTPPPAYRLDREEA